MAEATTAGVKPVEAPSIGGLNWGDVELRNKQITFSAKLVGITQGLRKIVDVDENGNPSAPRFEVQPNRWLATFAVKDDKGVWHTKKPVSTFKNQWPFEQIPQSPGLMVQVTMYENEDGYPTLMKVDYDVEQLGDKTIRLMEMTAKLKQGSPEDVD